MHNSFCSYLLLGSPFIGRRGQLAKTIVADLGVITIHRGCPKKLTRVAAPSPRASLGRRTVCGRTEQLSAAGFEALRN